MKPIILILAFIATPFFMMAQVPKTVTSAKQGKDWLLWYQGTRKNDSVLLANNGWQITYSRNKNTVQVKTPAKSRNFQRIELELAKSKLRKKEAINKITVGAGPIAASDLPMIRLVLHEIGDVEKQYADVLKTNIRLPDDELLSSAPASRTGKGKGPARDEENDYDEEFNWQQLFSTVQNDMKALKNVDDLRLPAPPEYDISVCWICDSTQKKQFHKKADDYLKDLVKEEQVIIANIFRLYQYFDTREGTTVDPQISNAKIELTKNIEAIQSRVSKKIVKLVKANEHEFLKLVSLMPFILTLDRQNQLFGIGTLPPELDIASLIKNEDLNAYVDKLIAAQDYSRLLNFSWISGTDRTLQMLGNRGIDDRIIPKVLKFNRFALTVSYDVKEVDNDGEHSLKGMVKSKVTYYRAIPTNHCKFFFVQSTGSKALLAGVGQPFINFDLLQAEQTKCSYTGTKKWVAIDPYIKIGFCGAEDSVSLFPLIPNLQQPMETWQCEEAEEHLTNLFASAFENNDPMGDDEEELLKELQTIQKFTASLSTPDAVIDDVVGLNRGYALVATIKEKYGQNAQTIVPVNANNSSTVLFDKLHNGMPYSTDQNLVYANLWIKLEHIKE